MEDDGRRERARALNFMLKTTRARNSCPITIRLIATEVGPGKVQVNHTVDLFTVNEVYAPLRVFFRAAGTCSARKHNNTLALVRNMGSTCC